MFSIDRRNKQGASSASEEPTATEVTEEVAEEFDKPIEPQLPEEREKKCKRNYWINGIGDTPEPIVPSRCELRDWRCRAR